MVVGDLRFIFTIVCCPGRVGLTLRDSESNTDIFEGFQAVGVELEKLRA